MSDIKFDRDNPEWTEEDFKKAKPAHEVLPKNILDQFPNTRGAQKAPTKVPVSIRLSPEVVKHYKAQGKGWQGRINDALLRNIGSEIRTNNSRSRAGSALTMRTTRKTKGAIKTAASSGRKSG